MTESDTPVVTPDETESTTVTGEETPAAGAARSSTADRQRPPDERFGERERGGPTG